MEKIFDWVKAVGNSGRPDLRKLGERSFRLGLFVGATYNLLRMGKIMSREATT